MSGHHDLNRHGIPATGQKGSFRKKNPSYEGFFRHTTAALPDYGATVQVAVLLLQVVSLSPGAFGLKVPPGMLPLEHALAVKPGMGIEDTDADSHELA